MRLGAGVDAGDVAAFVASHKRRVRAVVAKVVAEAEADKAEADDAAESEQAVERGSGGAEASAAVAPSFLAGADVVQQPAAGAQAGAQAGVGMAPAAAAWAVMAYRDGVEGGAAAQKRQRLSKYPESIDLRPRLREVLDGSGGAAGARGGTEARALATAERSVSGRKLLCQVLAATTDPEAIEAMHSVDAFVRETPSQDAPSAAPSDAPVSSPPPPLLPPRMFCSLALWLKEAREDGLSTLLQFCLVALQRAPSTTAQRRAARLGFYVERLHGHSSKGVRDFSRGLTARWRKEDMQHDAAAPINQTHAAAATDDVGAGADASNAAAVPPTDGAASAPAPAAAPPKLPKRPLRRNSLAAAAVTAPGAAAAASSISQAKAMLVEPSVRWPPGGAVALDLSVLRQPAACGGESSEAAAQAVRELSARPMGFVGFGSPAEPEPTELMAPVVPDDAIPVMPLEVAKATGGAAAQASSQLGQLHSGAAVPPREALAQLLQRFGAPQPQPQPQQTTALTSTHMQPQPLQPQQQPAAEQAIQQDPPPKTKSLAAVLAKFKNRKP